MLHIACYMLLVTCYKKHMYITYYIYILHITYYILHITYYMLHITKNILHHILHISHVYYILHRICCSVLQCVAVCCSVLQCVAVCCSVLQCVAVCCIITYYTIYYISWGATLSIYHIYDIRDIPIMEQLIKNTLQHTATHCNTM